MPTGRIPSATNYCGIEQTSLDRTYIVELIKLHHKASANLKSWRSKDHRKTEEHIVSGIESNGKGLTMKKFDGERWWVAYALFARDKWVSLFNLENPRFNRETNKLLQVVCYVWVCFSLWNRIAFKDVPEHHRGIVT